RLAPPKGLFRDRPWEQPDQFIMSRNEDARNFPHDPYADELNMMNWPKQQMALSDSITTQKESAVAVNVRKLTAGWYLTEAGTVGRFGDTVRSKKYIRLDAERSIVSPFATATLSVNRPVAKPGEQVTIELVTNLENPQTVYDLGSAKNARENRPALNRNKPVTRTITDSDVGGLPVSAFFIRHNRIFSVQ